MEIGNWTCSSQVKWDAKISYVNFSYWQWCDSEMTYTDNEHSESAIDNWADVIIKKLFTIAYPLLERPNNALKSIFESQPLHSDYCVVCLPLLLSTLRFLTFIPYWFLNTLTHSHYLWRLRRCSTIFLVNRLLHLHRLYYLRRQLQSRWEQNRCPPQIVRMEMNKRGQLHLKLKMLS